MASWTNIAKNTSSYSNAAKNLAGASWDIKSFLLQEDTFFLLQEDGYKLVLQWGTTKNTSSWTNISKN